MSEPSDVAEIEQLLDRLASGSDPRQSLAFDAAAPLWLARAPGRLDVMGGFADYSGSLALEMPIAEAAFVIAQATAEPRVRVLSLAPRGAVAPRAVVFPLGELLERTSSYGAARQYFARDPAQAWSGYVAGVIAALGLELGEKPRSGLTLLLASSVPEGKGTSSSAALEVASLFALCGVQGLELEPVRAALLCQRVENLVVGAPCGAMDQITSSAGIEGRILPLLCQPAQLGQAFPVPSAFRLWGIDSGVRHQVSGADYTEVRVAAFMGYAMIGKHLGLRTSPGLREGHVRMDDPLYGGYLANIPSATFAGELAPLLPERLTGAEFLREYAGITDAVTSVQSQAVYRVRAATRHPIEEHGRCRQFERLMLEAAGAGPVLREIGLELGELMYRAHRSYTECGLGSSGTDRLVELVQECGPDAGLYGAKITGGGSGGTVAVLGDREAAPAVLEVCRRYAAETGHTPHLFMGSSPGAAEFGVRRVSLRGGRHRVEPKTNQPARGTSV